VTMEEHGVSKIVSVKFHKTENGAEKQTARPLVQPVEAEEDAPHTRTDTVDITKSE